MIFTTDSDIYKVSTIVEDNIAADKVLDSLTHKKKSSVILGKILFLLFTIWTKAFGHI